MISDELLDGLMRVMDAAFEPVWREAWTRSQVANSLALPTTHAELVDAQGDPTIEPEEVVGFLMSRAAPGEEELLLIAVHPEHRGSGIGRKLLHSFAEAARLRGAQKLFLEMRANNPAESVYRRAGYEPIGRRRDYYRTTTGNRLDAITFGKVL